MPDRHTATTITDAKLDRLYAKLAKAQKWRNDYARRLDSVLAVVNPVADAPLSHGYDDSERAVRDFAREVRALIDRQQPADPAQPVRGTLEVQLNGQWTDITEHATPEGLAAAFSTIDVRAALNDQRRADTAARSAAQWEDTARTYAKDAADWRGRAETAEQRLAAAKQLTDEQAQTIRRMLRNLRDTERRLTDARKAYTDADARATLRACQLVGARETLRATEDDLADARRRLAALPKPDALACNGAEPANPNSPVHALRGALTDGYPLTETEAADLITPYFRYVHDKFCTRPHGETAEPADGPSLRGQLAAMADRANRLDAAACRRHPLCTCHACRPETP